jgi:hypothetical protein
VRTPTSTLRGLHAMLAIVTRVRWSGCNLQPLRAERSTDRVVFGERHLSFANRNDRRL